MRTHRLRREDLRDGSTREFHQAGVAGCVTMGANMLCQQPHRPELFGIAQILGLLAGQRDYPGLRFGRNLGRAPTARHIGQRRQRPQLQSFVDTALHLRSIGIQGARNRGDCRATRVTQHHLGALHARGRLRSRAADRLQCGTRFIAQIQRRASTLKRHQRSSEELGPRRIDHTLDCSPLIR